MEKFMSLWCNKKAFRSDYEKRLLPSLDSRQLSRDGRMRNPDEKPLVVVETPVVSESEPKPIVKKIKEEPKPAPQKDALPPQKSQTGVGKVELKAKSEKIDSADEEIGGMEKVQKQEKAIDEAKLKELKREEEMAKAKQAMERKKKLAEKAAAKAAIRAQKEAEKKLKERKKKLKKTTSASALASDPDEQTDAVEETVVEEPEQVEEKEETPVPASAPFKEKARREGIIRYKNRVKGSDSLPPKAILRKKKSTNWMYAVPIAVAVVVLLVALGYPYLSSLKQ